MNRTEYNKCMIPYISGSKPKEQRKSDFCIGAKMCSGRANTREEASRLCAEAAANPKPPKVKKTRRSTIDTITLATCVIKGLDGSEISLDNLAPIIASCTGQKVAKTGREAFIKRCFKENTAGDGFQYDIKEAQKLRSFCTARWKEQEEGL